MKKENTNKATKFLLLASSIIVALILVLPHSAKADPPTGPGQVSEVQGDEEIQETEPSCPPGTILAPAGEGEGVLPITTPVGVPAGEGGSSEEGEISSERILREARKYEGRAYGQGNGEFVETSFVEQILRDVGIEVTREMHDEIFLTNERINRERNQLLNSNDNLIKGIAYAITSSGNGEESSLETASAGDFIQYWTQENRARTAVWTAHSGIIKNVREHGQFDVYGAHASEQRVMSKEVNLLGAGNKAYIARLTEREAGGERTEPRTATGQRETTGQRANCGRKIALVGDSLTASPINYIRFLRELCPESEIRNEDDDPSTSYSAGGTDKFAVVGRRTSAMKSNLPYVLAWQPDTIVLIGGTNDLGGMSVQPIIDNLREMYQTAQARGIRVVSATVAPFGDEQRRNTQGIAGKATTNEERGRRILEHLTALNEWILSADNPADIKIDFYHELENPNSPNNYNPELYGGDKVHPNAAGQRIMAREIYEGLTGAPEYFSEFREREAGQAEGGEVRGAGTGRCVPASLISSIVYDFVITSSSGLTKILGIPRQHIAVGVNKTYNPLAGAECQQTTAELEYDVEYLRNTYGQSQMEVESQLVEMQFMEQPVRIHRTISAALACTEREILECEEAQSYDFRTIESYNWQAVEDEPELLATSSFGIAVNINLDTNPNAQNEELITDIPECVVQAFKRHGFRWGGEYETAKCPSHFEYMARSTGAASLIVEQQGEEQPEGGVGQEDTRCNINIPPNLDSQSVGPPGGGGSLENGYEVPRETETIKFTKAESNRRNFATVEFARALMRAACVIKERHGVKTGFGELSEQNGGDLGNHQSHESGRDGDIWFFRKTSAGYQELTSGWAAVPRSTPMCEEQQVSSQFDLQANYEFIKAFTETQPTKNIFLDCNIKNALKQYAQREHPGEWERAGFEEMIRHAPSHHHHYHIRIDCPEGDTRCRE
jgi:lysophospholipase L1-like esterase/murein endopeptidase